MLQKICFIEPAHGTVVKVSESHTANCAIQVPDPEAWKTHQTHACMAKILRGQRRRDHSSTITLVGCFFTFLLYLSLPLMSTSILQQNFKSCMFSFLPITYGPPNKFSSLIQSSKWLCNFNIYAPP